MRLRCLNLAMGFLLICLSGCSSFHNHFENCVSHGPDTGDALIDDCTQYLDSPLSGGGMNLLPAHVSRGDLYADKRDYDHAIADYDEALKYDEGKGSYSYKTVGGACKYLGLVGALTCADDNTIGLLKVYIHRGDAYAAKGDLERAIEDYDHVLKLDPNNSLALGKRAATVKARDASATR